MTREQLIEACAKAAYDARHKGLKNCWEWDDSELDVEHPETRTIDRTCARAILTLIETHAVIVPIEPGKGEIEKLALEVWIDPDHSQGIQIAMEQHRRPHPESEGRAYQVVPPGTQPWG